LVDVDTGIREPLTDNLKFADIPLRSLDLNEVPQALRQLDPER
jgi:hypothetical protein